MRRSKCRKGEVWRVVKRVFGKGESIMRGFILALTAVVFFTSTGVFAEPRDGLISYYNFSGTADDASGNGHDGILYGPRLTTDRRGVANAAYEFDGVDDYINVLFSGAFRTTDYTLAAWINPNSGFLTDTEGVIVAGRGEDFQNDRAWSWLDIGSEGNPWGTGIRAGLETNSDADFVYDTGVFPETNTWTHLAATRSTDGELTIYEDGTVIGHWDSSATPSTMSEQDFTIGTRWSSQSGPYHRGNYFSGLMDDIMLYDRALDADEVAELARYDSPYPKLGEVVSDDGGTPMVTNPQRIADVAPSNASYVKLTDLTIPATSVATILLEAADYAPANGLGIYSYKGAGVAPSSSEMLDIFAGADGLFTSATLEFDLADGTVWYDRNGNLVPDADEIAMIGDTFGFYMTSPDQYGGIRNPLFFTDDVLNPDTLATKHGLIYDTGSITGGITGDPDIVLAFEDLLAGHSDWDYSDMVISVTDVTPWTDRVNPIPLPGAGLLGVLGLSCAGMRLRRRAT